MSDKTFRTNSFVAVRQGHNVIVRGIGRNQKVMFNFYLKEENLNIWLLYCLRTWSFDSHVAATCYFVFSWKAQAMVLTIKQGEQRFTISGEDAIQDFLKFLS